MCKWAKPLPTQHLPVNDVCAVVGVEPAINNAPPTGGMEVMLGVSRLLSVLASSDKRLIDQQQIAETVLAPSGVEYIDCGC